MCAIEHLLMIACSLYTYIHWYYQILAVRIQISTMLWEINFVIATLNVNNFEVSNSIHGNLL